MSSPDMRSITNVIDPLLAERLDYVPSSTRDSLAEAIASRVRVLLATSHDTREAQRRHVKNPYSEHCLWDSEPWPCNVAALLDQPASKPDDAGRIDVERLLSDAFAAVDDALGERGDDYAVQLIRLRRGSWRAVASLDYSGSMPADELAGDETRDDPLAALRALAARLTTNPEDQG